MALYNITASRGTRQTFCVDAVQADLVGHFADGALVRPDIAALREALPAQWRKALDRTTGRFWFDHASNKPCYLTLHFPRADSVTLVATLQP